MKKFLLATVLTLMISATVAAPAYAAVTIPSNYHPAGLPTISGDSAEAEELIGLVDENQAETARLKLTQRIVNFIMGLAGIVAVYFIMNSAFNLIIAGGSEDKITQHKKGLMWAVLGLIFIIFAYTIIRFIITLSYTAEEAPAAPPGAAGAPAGAGGGALPPMPGEDFEGGSEL